jgi:hypothetical protein
MGGAQIGLLRNKLLQLRAEEGDDHRRSSLAEEPSAAPSERIANLHEIPRVPLRFTLGCPAAKSGDIKGESPCLATDLRRHRKNGRLGDATLPASNHQNPFLFLAFETKPALCKRSLHGSVCLIDLGIDRGVTRPIHDWMQLTQEI